MKKITKEELEKVVDFQNKLYKITTDIGVLESQNMQLYMIQPVLIKNKKNTKKYQKISMDQ